MAPGSDSIALLVRRFRATDVSLGATAAAICLPPIFLHVRWQPGVAVEAGSTSLNLYLSDFAVLAIAALAVAAGLRHGFAPLRAGRWIWATAAALLVWIVAGVAVGRLESSGYPWQTHAATAAKWAEYAVLAPSLPLLLRRSRDLLAPLWSLTLWSVVATGVGVAQALGASIFVYGVPGARQGSFLSDADFAAYSAAVLVVGLVALVRPELRLGRRLGAVAMASGLLGMILAAAVASALGLATGAAAMGAVLLLRRELPRRRALAAGAAALVAAGGVLVYRGGDLGSFAHFLNSSPSSSAGKEKTVQTYAHRTLLAWIGLQIWKDHPVVGAGWQSSGDPETFERYVPAARRHFATEPADAFPTREHPFTTQNVWIEALAELGVVGLAALVALFATVALVAWRSARAAGGAASLIGLGWTGLVVWLSTAQSFVAGIPLDAILWLGFGLAAAGAALAAVPSTAAPRSPREWPA